MTNVPVICRLSLLLIIGGGGDIFAFPVWNAGGVRTRAGSECGRGQNAGGVRISESIASDSGCATRTFTVKVSAVHPCLLHSGC